MIDNPSNGWQAINRRVADLQRKVRTQNEPTAIDEHGRNAVHNADLPFGRSEVRLEVQKYWWQL
jgi:hypothetical protein